MGRKGCGKGPKILLPVATFDVLSDAQETTHEVTCPHDSVERQFFNFLNDNTSAYFFSVTITNSTTNNVILVSNSNNRRN